MGFPEVVSSSLLESRRAGGGKAIGFKEFRPSVESAEESGS